MRRLATTIALLGISTALACGRGESPTPPTPSPVVSVPRDGRTESFDGLSIAYTVSGSGDGALVFVHGWSCDRGYWEAQVEDLSPDFRVVTIDLAGHGDSGSERTDWSVEAFGRDVEAVVDDLGLESVILVGHSMGGFVALEAARRMPGRVAGVIGVDTLHDVELRYPDEAWKQILDGLGRDFRGACDGFVRGLFPPSADPELVTEVAGDMCAAPPAVGIATLRAASVYDAAAGADAAGVPLRCINGTTFPTNVETNRKHVPDFDVYRMDGVGHFPMLERPDEFNRLLRQAVEELTASRTTG